MFIGYKFPNKLGLDSKQILLGPKQSDSSSKTTHIVLFPVNIPQRLCFIFGWPPSFFCWFIGLCMAIHGRRPKKFPPLQGPSKEYVRTTGIWSYFLSQKTLGLHSRFLAFPQGPGGFRKLWEASRSHFHLSWHLQVPMVTSYGQKPFWGGNCSYRVRIQRLLDTSESFEPVIETQTIKENSTIH